MTIPVINLHPIFVHFPIGLLTIYSILEMLVLFKMATNPFWQRVKLIFLLLGCVTSWFTLLSGNLISHEFRSHLTSIHSNVAGLTIILYHIALIIHLLAWLKNEGWLAHHPLIKQLEKLSTLSAHLLKIPSISFALGLVSFALLSLTGALGGAIAYGQDIDPFTNLAVQFVTWLGL